MRAFLLFLIALVGCGADTYVDPAGSWQFVMTWAPSTSCGLSGSRAVTTTVVKVGDAYAITESGRNLTGTIVCTTDWCRMSLSESGPGDPGSGVDRLDLAIDLTVDDHDVITGGGSATVTRNIVSCSQSFSASGMLR